MSMKFTLFMKFCNNIYKGSKSLKKQQSKSQPKNQKTNEIQNQTIKI